MEVKIPTEKEFEWAYRRDIASSFPAAELRPLDKIAALWRNGRYQPWCLYDQREIVAECFLCPIGSDWALLDYLCVSARRRNAGLGGLLLRQILRQEPALSVFAECEKPAFVENPAAAERRIAFYLRSGGRLAGYEAELFGVRYQIVYLGERAGGEAGLLQAHRAVYKNCFSPEQYARHLRIPCDAKAPPAEKTAWIE